LIGHDELLNQADSVSFYGADAFCGEEQMGCMAAADAKGKQR
jgi:hypothetical protein